MNFFLSVNEQHSFTSNLVIADSVLNLYLFCPCAAYILNPLDKQSNCCAPCIINKLFILLPSLDYHPEEKEDVFLLQSEE